MKYASSPPPTEPRNYRPTRGNAVGQAAENTIATLEANGGLATADHVAPGVLWIDEIEKGLAGATQGANDGGTSTRLVG